MIFTIVIILIVVLIIVAIVVNALQQHKEKVEAEKRTEVAKQKSIIDETENVLLAADTIPVSQKLVFILHQRVFNALRVINELNPGVADIRQRLRDAEDKKKTINIDQPPPAQENFKLPDNDKLIIQYIQTIKKFRVLLRSEHSKGKVDTQTYTNEEKTLSTMQLKVNVETLARRANAALKSNMLGSARQYYEKAIGALNSQAQPSEYSQSRKAELEQQLKVIQENLRNANAEEVAKKQEEERDELDELFAPKKKW